MITYHTAIVFISCLSMAVMIAGTESNHLLPRLRKRFFQLLFLLLIITNLTEWLAETLGGTSTAPVLLILFKFTEFCVAPFIPIVCMLALSDLNRLPRWIAIPALFNLVLQLVSLVSGCVFFIGPGNHYQRGALYGLYLAFVVLEALLLMLHCLRFSQKYRYTNFWFLILINLLGLMGAVVSYLAIMALLLVLLIIEYAHIRQRIERDRNPYGA